MPREDVDALEVELRRRDREIAIGMIERDVLERERRLFPPLELEERSRAEVLHLDELLLPVGVALLGLDVTDVALEGVDHPLLAGRRVLGLVLLVCLFLDVLTRAREVALADPVGSRLVLEQVDLLVAEHRRVRGLGGVGTVRILLDDGVERRSARAPLSLGLLRIRRALRAEVDEVGHVVFDLVDRRPVFLHELEREVLVLVLRPRLRDLAVELRRRVHRARVTGAALSVRADGLEVPRHRRLGHHRGGLVGALLLRVLAVILGLEGVVSFELVVELLDDGGLVATLHRHRRFADVALIRAGLVAVGIADEEIFVERDGVGVVPGVDVVEPQVVHHLERLVVRPLRVARQVLEEVVRVAGAAALRVHWDDVAPRTVSELARIGQRRVRRPVIDDLLEGL